MKQDPSSMDLPSSPEFSPDNTQYGSRPHPDEPLSAPTPMMLVNEVTKMFFNLMRDDNAGAGHHNSVRWILSTLSRMDGVTQLDLANATHLKPPTISVALQKMEASGLVRRETDPVDQRQTRVYLTEEGAAYHQKMRQKLREMERLALEDISEEESEALSTILTKIKNNLIRIPRG